MKKYSTDYFEKKYRVLLDKLTQKDGFLVDVKNTRKELGLPENGFSSSPELAQFFISKMSKAEQQSLTLWAFISEYEYQNKIRVTEENNKEVVNKFLKKYKKGIGMLPMIFELIKNIEAHHELITKNHLFDENKYLSKLYKTVMSLMQKYWGVDLLDDHIIFHYIEKYIFLGHSGINNYIKSKVSCHNCKYIGIEHFSPNRFNMDGKDEGPYSSKYLFNEKTVQMLSQYFNGVFVIVKPYATKELVIEYIEENWDDLKEHMIEKNTFYKQFDVHPAIIKESDDEKNRLVYELHKLSKKDLLKKYKGGKDFSQSGIYKEVIVSAILDEEYKIAMSSDAVKKSASRFAKSIKVQKLPKDIRDI